MEILRRRVRDENEATCRNGSSACHRAAGEKRSHRCRSVSRSGGGTGDWCGKRTQQCPAEPRKSQNEPTIISFEAIFTIIGLEAMAWLLRILTLDSDDRHETTLRAVRVLLMIPMTGVGANVGLPWIVPDDEGSGR